MKWSTMQKKFELGTLEPTMTLLFTRLDLESLGESTYREGFSALRDRIKSEHSYIANETERTLHHLQGLGSGLDIPFMNYDILTWAKSTGLLKDNATEKREDTFLENYWNVCAFKLLQICRAIEQEAQNV